MFWNQQEFGGIKTDLKFWQDFLMNKIYFFLVQMKVTFSEILKIKEKINVDANNELSEEELQFWNEIDKFWNVEYDEILPKSRGSNVIHCT